MANPPTPPSERALLQHGAFLKSLAVSLLNDEHLADDVVQSTWVAALESPREPARGWLAWMKGVTRNLAINLRLRRRRAQKHEGLAAKTAAGLPADETLAREEVLRAVTDAVLELNDPERATILMRYYEGLMPQEIAARTSVPVATVKSRIYRALRRLRHKLDQHGGDRGTWGMGLAAFVGSGRWMGSTLIPGAMIVNAKTKLAVTATFLILAVGGAGLWFGENPSDVSLGDRGGPLAGEHGSITADKALSASSSGIGMSNRTKLQPELTGSLVLQVRFGDTGEPASCVQIGVYPHGPQMHAKALTLCTDDRGQARLDGLAPGMMSLYVERGGHGRVKVEPGREVHATLAIPSGIDVEGKVVDAQGRAVGQAEFCLQGLFHSATTVGQADPSGRFLVRSVEVNGQSIMARKEGYAPSRSLSIHGAAGSRLRVSLVLPEPGAAVRVRVSDAAGHPLSGAWVRVDCGSGYMFKRSDGLFSARPLSTLLRTDDTGTCVAKSVTAGRIGVYVDLLPFAPWSDARNAVAGEELDVNVALVRGVSLTGRVTSTNQRPVSGAVVAVGGFGSLGRREAWTAPDGSYRILGIAPGSFKVGVFKEGAGQVQRLLEGRDGQEILFNPVLDSGLVLRGRLLDESGKGLSGWWVNLHSGSGRERRWLQAKTGEDGRFTLLNCPEGAHVLQMVERRGSSYGAHKFGPVRAGPEEHEFRVLDAERMSAWISGRVLSSEGKPVSAEVIVGAPGSGVVIDKHGDPLSAEAMDELGQPRRFWSDQDAGRFRVGPVRPGPYAVNVAAGRLRVPAREFDLKANEEHKLGDLVLGGPGALTLRLGLPKNANPKWVWVSVVSREPCMDARIRLTAEGIPPRLELPAGRWLVRVTGAVMAQKHFVVIKSGADTVLDTSPQATAEVRLAVRPLVGKKTASVRVRILSPTGRVVNEKTDELTEPRRLIHVRVPPADSYRVEVVAKDGRRGETWIDRTAQDLSDPAARVARPAPVEILLR